MEEYWSELQIQLKTSIPTTLAYVLYKIPWLISLHFVGNMGSNELAAASFASALCDVTGMSFAVGLSTAITTLTGQARGELLRLQKQKLSKKEVENFKSPLIYLYRGIIVDLLLVLPIAFVYFRGIAPYLEYSFGQSHDLSIQIQAYLQTLTLGLISYSIHFTLSAWCQALEMADIPAQAAFLGVCCHVPFNLFFIKILKFGYLGVGLATTMFQFIQPVYICCYFLLVSKGRERLHKECFVYNNDNVASVERGKFLKQAFSFRGMIQYLSLGIPGLVVVSEWWASNVAIFLSTKLSSIALDGMTIYQTINSSCFMLPLGASVGGSTRVGNFLGMGDYRQARKSAYVCVIYAMSCSACMSFLLFSVRPNTIIPSFFTPDSRVQRETASVLTYLSIYVFGDGIQVAFNGVIKGCGRQCITMPIVLFAYWVVGVPLAYLLTFGINHGVEMECQVDFICGIKGLVLGMTIGTWVHMLLLVGTVVFGTNWELESQKARRRFELEEEKQIILNETSDESLPLLRSQ